MEKENHVEERNVSDHCSDNETEKSKLTQPKLIEFDDYLGRYVGHFKRRQIMLFFMISMEIIFVAFYSMGPVFQAMVPNHWCKPPDLNMSDCTSEEIKNVYIPKKNGKYESCKYFNISDENLIATCTANSTNSSSSSLSTLSCNQYEYSTEYYDVTIVSEWNLVCGSEALVSTINAVFMFGRMAGCLIFGPLTDRLGRRPIILVLTTVEILAGLTLALAPGFVWVIVARFTLGFVGLSRGTAAFVLAMELVGPKWRVKAGILYMTVWAIGYVAFAFVAYLFTNWRHLALAITVPEVLLIIIFLVFLPESPRWQLVKGHTKKAMEMLKKIAIGNGKEKLPDNITVVAADEQITATIWDLMKCSGIRFATFNMGFAWFSLAFVYYGLSLNTSNLGGNPFINCFISGAVEIPAYLSCIYLLENYGRVPSIGGYTMIGSLALLATCPVPESLPLVSTVLAMIGKFFIAAAFSMIWIYSPEIYPTSLRVVGVSTCSMCARLSSLVASYVFMLSDVHRILPLLIFGIVSLTASILVFQLPETKGKPLPQTIEDSEILISQRQGFIGTIKSLGTATKPQKERNVTV